MTVGERIKQRRLELGLSQDELAKKVGYKSRSSINKIELSRNLPLKKVAEMARVLDTTPAFLMGWDDDMGNYCSHVDKEATDYLIKDKDIEVLLEVAKNSKKEDVKMATEFLKRLNGD